MKTSVPNNRPHPVGYLVYEVARLMKRRFEAAARDHGVTLPQWRALAVIAQNDGIAQVALASKTDTDPMTMSGILDRLEKRGLIERYPDPADSRAKLAKLTDTGLALYATARAVGHATYEAALDGIAAEERATVERVLSRMRDNLTGLVAEIEDVKE